MIDTPSQAVRLTGHELPDENALPVVLTDIDLPKVPRGAPMHVRVTAFDMPFMGLVGFMLKVAIAAIPATILIAVVYTVIGGFFGALLMHR